MTNGNWSIEDVRGATTAGLLLFTCGSQIEFALAVRLVRPGVWASKATTVAARRARVAEEFLDLVGKTLLFGIIPNIDFNYKRRF